MTPHFFYISDITNSSSYSGKSFRKKSMLKKFRANVLKCIHFLSLQKKMSKANKIEWSNIDGALPKPKRLHLEKDDVDSLYHCPIQLCEHEGFQSQRGCRKHVNNKHSWFFYFDEKPRVDLKLATNSSKVPTKSCASSTVVDDVSSSTRSKPGPRSMPSFSSSSQIGEQFTTWLA